MEDFTERILENRTQHVSSGVLWISFNGNCPYHEKTDHILNNAASWEKAMRWWKGSRRPYHLPKLNRQGEDAPTAFQQKAASPHEVTVKKQTWVFLCRFLDKPHETQRLLEYPQLIGCTKTSCMRWSKPETTFVNLRCRKNIFLFH